MGQIELLWSVRGVELGKWNRIILNLIVLLAGKITAFWDDKPCGLVDINQG
jgi:hypothetical protein